MKTDFTIMSLGNKNIEGDGKRGETMNISTNENFIKRMEAYCNAAASQLKIG